MARSEDLSYARTNLEIYGVGDDWSDKFTASHAQVRRLDGEAPAKRLEIPHLPDSQLMF